MSNMAHRLGASFVAGPSCNVEKGYIMLWTTLVLMLGLCLGLLLPVQAQDTCVPTVTEKTSYTVAWDAPTSQASGVTLTGYLLERKVNEGPWIAFPLMSATTLSLRETDIAPGTYAYQVRAQGKLADDTVLLSPYAKHGSPPPCVTIVVVSPPSNLQLRVD
jgi:hypothetical protein